MTNLKVLKCCKDRAVETNDLENLTKLESLEISFGTYQVRHLTNLTSLALDRKAQVDPADLGFLTKLTSLKIEVEVNPLLPVLHKRISLLRVPLKHIPHVKRLNLTELLSQKPMTVEEVNSSNDFQRLEFNCWALYHSMLKSTVLEKLQSLQSLYVYYYPYKNMNNEPMSNVNEALYELLKPTGAGPYLIRSMLPDVSVIHLHIMAAFPDQRIVKKLVISDKKKGKHIPF